MKAIKEKDSKTKIKKEKSSFKDILKKNWGWIVFIIALIGFAALLEDVFENEIMTCDVIAYKVIVESCRNDVLTNVMKVVTCFGNAQMIIGITLIATIGLIIKDKRKIALGLCSNAVIIALFNYIIKNIVQRPRPYGYRLIDEKGFSFPSGHSMVCTAFYGLLIYYIYTNVKNVYVKWILCFLLVLLIPTIAFSRVYLGVHYLSDVLGGFLFSIAYLVCFIKIYKAIKLGGKDESK